MKFSTNEYLFLRHERSRYQKKIELMKYEMKVQKNMIDEQKKYITELVEENRQLKKSLDSKE